MRGSIYYQTSLLAKCVLKEGVKKESRVDRGSLDHKKVASFKTMETYRRVWNNLGLYVRDEFGIKDLEELTAEHIESYMLQKVDIAPSKQYMEKISSALGKLSYALYVFRAEVDKNWMSFDFSIRQQVLDQMRSDGLVYDGYHNRVYQAPEQVIENLSTHEHQLAAQIQLASGARFEGVGLVKKYQIKKKSVDPVTGRETYLIETKEKGGKVGMIYLSPELHQKLLIYIDEYGTFKIDYQQYSKDIRETCKRLGINPEGSHGFRWSFARRRIREYQKYGSSYDEALLGASMELKHNRKDISEHYIG